jgi:hypothetical protein
MSASRGVPAASGRVARSLVSGLLVAALSACNPAAPATPPSLSTIAPRTPAPTAVVLPTAAAVATPIPTPTPVPGGPTLPPHATTPSQSAIDWGTIWDDVPESFPIFPAAERVEKGNPTSVELNVDPNSGPEANPGGVAIFYDMALRSAGYTVSVAGPLADGSFTVAAQRNDGCRVHVSAIPIRGTTIASVLYGAGCPFP